MDFTSQPTISTDLEDFRRLGVRPHECRLTVIRRAAARSAGALAKKQLTSPSQQVGLQLSRVATSAYRLLDPRYREDSHQRAFVGRIAANALIWNDQTKFHHQGGRSSRRKPFDWDGLSDAERIELLDLDAPTRSQREVQGWALDLKDDDLLDTATRNGRFRRFGTQWRRPVAWLVLAGLVIGSLFAWVAIRNQQSSAVRLASEEPTPSTTIEVTLDESPAKPNVQYDEPVVAVAETHETNVDPFESPDESFEGVNVGQPSIAEAEFDVPTDITVETALELNRWSALTPHELSEPSLSQTEVADLVEAAAPVEPDVQPVPELLEKQVDATVAIEAIGKSDGSSRTEDHVSAFSTPDLPQARRNSIPSAEVAEAAREGLIEFLRDTNLNRENGDVWRRMEAIEKLEEGLSIGSADFWAARLMIAELAWHVEDFSSVRNRVEALTEHYDAKLSDLLTESFVIASVDTPLHESYARLWDSGLQLAEELLTAESPEQCDRVVDALRPLMQFVETDESRSYLQRMSQSAKQMKRLAASSRRIMEDAVKNDGDLDDVGILGRYYCLMLRKWDVGLSWLAEISDPRIAAAARMELDIGDSAPADELVLLADRWLAVADRLSDRASDSVRLHSLELFRKAREGASGLKRLEIERSIGDIEQSLPSFLQVTPANSAPDFEAKSRKPLSPVPQTAARSAKEGLSGRIVIDGQDVGIQLNYQLDVAFTQAVLDSIAERLNRNLPPMAIQFTGQFELADPTSILLSIAPSPQGVSQEVLLNGAAIDSGEDANERELLLDAGRHEVVWSIDAERFSRLFLRIRDAESGQRLSVSPPADRGGVPKPTILTVELVRGRP